MTDYETIQRLRDAEAVWPWLFRFVVYVGGTILAAAIAGYGLACAQHGALVHLRELAK